MTANNPQCKTCNMTDEVQEYLYELFTGGVSFKAMVGMLERDRGIHIADTSLGNHYRKHVRSTPSSVSNVEVKTNNGNLRVKYPKGYTPSVELNEDGSGVVISMPQDSDKLITDYADILREMGVDPDSFRIVGTAGISKWMTPAGDWLTSYRVRIEKKEVIVEDNEESLPLLVESASKFGTRIEAETGEDSSKTLVVIMGDLQVGKSGSRGGTIELTERIREKQAALLDHIEKVGASSAVLADAGDIIEGFENVKQQEWTNDLSLMDQVDLAHTFESEFIEILSSTHEKVDVMSIPSNHAAWRKGKDYLGAPGDDWGIHIAKRVEKELDKYVPEHNVTFHYADKWRKSLNLEVQGYGLGLVHGDDVNRPEAIEQWWMKQVHGGSPTATSDVLVHGHFHTFRAYPSGRSLNGAQKWILGAPTLDNGSDWFANGSGGSDSDPGLLVFTIEKGKGLDMQSLTIL